mmetsp:Transcript_52443/g.139613  ORF Transcript_52443/g.139613 Transcript_52443/m.139613 type:complete len:251 (+) Transcript_52443:178-930(+)
MAKRSNSWTPSRSTSANCEHDFFAQPHELPLPSPPPSSGIVSRDEPPQDLPQLRGTLHAETSVRGSGTDLDGDEVARRCVEHGFIRQVVTRCQHSSERLAEERLLLAQPPHHRTLAGLSVQNLHSHVPVNEHYVVHLCCGKQGPQPLDVPRSDGAGLRLTCNIPVVPNKGRALVLPQTSGRLPHKVVNRLTHGVFPDLVFLDDGVVPLLPSLTARAQDLEAMFRDECETCESTKVRLEESRVAATDYVRN